MDVPSSRASGRALAMFTALSVAFAMLVSAPAVFGDDAAPDVRRLAGADRFGTAAAIAADTFDASTTDVIIAAGYRFPDSLAAAGLAGLVGAPVLLVNEVLDTPTAATLAALAQLRPDRLHIAGGTAAVSSSIQAQLAAVGDWTITRYAGVDRFDTAARMAGAFSAASVDTVIVATGRVAADSLAVGPLAYHAKHPILLAEVDELPQRTAAMLANLRPRHVLILGGTGAVSARVAAEIDAITGVTSQRLAGATRFETAVSIAERLSGEFPELVTLGQVSLATGFGPTRHSPGNAPVPADALSGAPYGGENGAPLLPINDVHDTLPDSVCAFLKANGDAIRDLTVFGGVAAVSRKVEGQAVTCASGTAPSPPPELGPNEAFGVAPGDTQLIEVGSGSAVEYTASGLTPGQSYEAALFPCGKPDEDATVKSDGDRYPNRGGVSARGTFTFRDQNLDDVADNAGSTQNGAAVILAVGSASVNARQASAVADTDGRITFKVGGGASVFDCAVPVVWRDSVAGGGGRLDLKAAGTNSWNQPAEDFGVGGALVLHGGEAATGAGVDGSVLFLDVDERFVVLGDGAKVRWNRSGDAYAYDGHVSGSIPRARFEQFLSIGDSLKVQAPYSRAGGNQFVLAGDRGHNVVKDVQAEVGDFNANAGTVDVRVSWDYALPPGANYQQFGVQMLHAGTLAPLATQATSVVSTLAPFDAPTAVVFEDVAAGTYVFRVEGRAGQTQLGAADRSLLSKAVTADATSVTPTGGPVILTQKVVLDRPVVNVLDKTDVVEITFDQEMDGTITPAINFQWSDGEGTYQVACDASGEADCSWHGAAGLTNNLLRMLIWRDPTLIAGTANQGLVISGVGAELMHVGSGVRSAEGLELDLQHSHDLRLNN